MKLGNLKSITGMALFTALALFATPPAQTQSLVVLHNFSGLLLG